VGLQAPWRGALVDMRVPCWGGGGLQDLPVVLCKISKELERSQDLLLARVLLLPALDALVRQGHAPLRMHQAQASSVKVVGGRAGGRTRRGGKACSRVLQCAWAHACGRPRVVAALAPVAPDAPDNPG
jgi:hypothetical protein